MGSRNLLTETVRREGLSVSSQYLSDLVAGTNRAGARFNHELLLNRRSTGSVLRVEIEDPLYVSLGRLWLSPDGKYLIVLTQVKNLPEAWKGYADARIQMAFRRNLPKGAPSLVRRYVLIDTSDGTNQPLVDAPVGSTGSEVAWSPDGRSVVITDVYLPLDVPDISETRARESNRFVVEVKIPSRELIKVTRKDLRLIKWDRKTSSVLFELRRADTTAKTRVAYRKVGEIWEECMVPAAGAEATQLNVVLEEDINTPPRIFAVDGRSHRKALLMDLNPQLSKFDLGRVEILTWKATDGHEVNGGLYYPPDYVPGVRYPLVIQTHGFAADRFWVDGPWPTAFAARPLAGRGFLVLQVEEGFVDRLTPNEPLRAMAAYDGAVAHLDDIGLADSTRVGLIGFSRTCLYVKYALTHSKYHYSAAVIADGMDAGYFQYLGFSNTIPEVASEFEAINNAAPFGEGLLVWMKLSPGFGLAKVRTPLHIQAIGPVSLLGEWEWFSGLSRLGKPVDLVYIPDGSHILAKPWERMTSQQGSVDWFCFWLKGEEDPDPGKAKLYARWRRMRERHEETEALKSPQMWE
jgi:dipeptidyl aminopeptidase/acylaminoacyl peptidase